jgi:hypothetical protein
MSSPTQRSLAKLRGEGYRAAVVEHWNPFAKIRQDLFGIIDIVALKANTTLGVQTTSYSNMSARIKKILASEAYNDIKAAGWKILCHGWKKNKSNRWEVVEREV